MDREWQRREREESDRELLERKRSNQEIQLQQRERSNQESPERAERERMEHEQQLREFIPQAWERQREIERIARERAVQERQRSLREKERGRRRLEQEARERDRRRRERDRRKHVKEWNVTQLGFILCLKVDRGLTSEHKAVLSPMRKENQHH